MHSIINVMKICIPAYYVLIETIFWKTNPQRLKKSDNPLLKIPVLRSF